MDILDLQRSEPPIATSEDRLDALFRAHASDALRLAYVMTGDLAAAEDVAQEAFVRIARKVFGFRDMEHGRAYLLRTVINLCRGRGRRAATERRAMDRLDRPGDALSPDPATQDEILRAMVLLPPRQKAALFLRYYLDQSEVTAAETLDCSLSALKSLVSRGLAAMRTTMEGTDHD